ncbi:MAG: hypothetical protein QOF98_3848, partial [Streptomyces sp.]|nr:hypothetical protein [Streptomyces sp.]
LAGEHDPANGVRLAAEPQAAAADSGSGGADAGTGAGAQPIAGGTPRPAGGAAGNRAADVAPAQAGASKVAFLFPGQGSQRPGMFAEAFIAFPELQHYLELGREHADALYPSTAFDDAGRDRRQAAITDTRVAQPALGIVGLAAYDLLTRAGVRPDMAAGHSYGELVALSAAGAIGPEALLELSGERAAAILAAAGDDPGTMAAVAAGAEDIEQALRAKGAPETVVVANRNSPRQTVISGPTEAVGEAVRLLREAGYGAKRIPVACAFHSPVVAGAGDRFAEALAQQTVRAPEFPVWSNRTAAPYGTAPDAVRAELAAQIGAPVGFVAQIEAMYEAGARVFVETGPGSVLTRLVGQILDGRPYRTVVCEPRPGSGLRGWLDALAELAVAGLPVRTGWLFQGRDAVDAARTPVPKRPGWTVDGHLVRTAAGALLPGALAPARRVVETTVTTNHPDGAAPDSRDALISEFLRTSREMVAAQRDVLLTYFGGAQGEWVPAPRAVGPVGAVRQAAPAELTAAPHPVLELVPQPAPSSQAPAGYEAAPAASAATGTVTEAEVLRLVLEIISERTGYPVDMIEPDLDLEADLSIDSIKRAEIAGELATRLGLGNGTDITALGDDELEELTKARTAAAVTDWLTARTAASTSASAPAAGQPVLELVPQLAVPEANILGLVLEIISERTGYPVDMIEPDLDLEADLSIDSIKRAEIAGELATRLGLGNGTDITALGDDELEELTKARTAAAVTDWLTARTAAPAPEVAAPAAPAPATQAVPEPAAVTGEAPKRLRFQPVLLPPQQDGTDLAAVLAGKRFVLLGDGADSADGEGDAGVAAEVAARLASYGADVVSLDQDHLLSGEDCQVDGVIHLDALAHVERPVLPDAFPVLQAALLRAPRWLLAVRPGGEGALGLRSAGLHGFFRTVAREYPGTVARVVDLAGPITPGGVADAVLAELAAVDATPVVLRTAAGRHGLDLVETPLGALGTTGAGPAGEGAAEAAALGLDRDSVVLLVGGARGITAKFAAALASASRCRIELLGRTAAPTGPEDPATAAAYDRSALRAALASRGGLTPAEVNRSAELVLAQREIAATLAELAALGSEARYRSVDLREPDAVLQAVKEIHAEHGRLDGVVYAAGVIEDRLIAEKTAESFQRVYGTKVSGAGTLLTALEELPNGPAFAVLFGSIAAALGNRGQVDYAAANDALQTLGAHWAARTGHRALTVHWGPWAPTGGHTGMVSPELGREYARRGVKLIDPEEGTAALLRELAWGEESAGTVVYTASGW